MKYTDNVRFNYKFSIIYFILLLMYAIHYNLSLYIPIISTLIFIYASAFFQPDLDLSVKRPGMTTFPMGNIIKNQKINKSLSQILYPINRLWYYFWHPYGALLTHRGISHCPIIGTLTRVGYIFIFCIIISKLSGINLSTYYLKLFFSQGFLKTSALHYDWVTFCLPIFISDIVHFIIDLYDSIKNNTKFRSYAHSPGILLNLINPSIEKYHKKALKKAKSNAKKRKRKKI